MIPQLRVTLYKKKHTILFSTHEEKPKPLYKAVLREVVDGERGLTNIDASSPAYAIEVFVKSNGEYVQTKTIVCIGQFGTGEMYQTAQIEITKLFEVSILEE